MRTLRFLTLILALSLALPVFAAPALAGSGSIFIPSSYIYYASASNQVTLGTFLSNISPNAIEVTIKLFYKAGTFVCESGSSSMLTGSLRAHNVSSYTEATSGSAGYTARFDIAAKQTGTFSLNPAHFSPSQSEFVYGTIEWRNKYSTNDDIVALLANAYYLRTYSDSGKQSQANHSIMLNNGMPF
jgi:hypothetical protein